MLKKGEKLFLQQKVDPALIGGFVIDIGALQHQPCRHFAVGIVTVCKALAAISDSICRQCGCKLARPLTSTLSQCLLPSLSAGDKHMDMSIIDRVKKVQQLILESND